MAEIIDAEGQLLGRMASKTAKMLLKGEQVFIVNAEKTEISGKKGLLVEKMRVKLNRAPKGNPTKGPKFSRMPDRMVKDAITNMLPKDRKRGRTAVKRLKVFIGVPGNLAEKKEKFKKIPEAESNVSRKTVKVGEISRLLGAKW